MNMRSIITPIEDELAADRASIVKQFTNWIWAKRAFLLVVALPTLLVASYYYLVASDQYVSEAHFIVRKAESTVSPPSGLGQLFGFGGSIGGSNDEAAGVTDYLLSHDAVSALNRNGDLVNHFRRPEADLLSRLNSSSPTPEKLLKYYRKQISVHTNRDTGITTVQVRAFRRDDAYEIMQRLLQLGEQRVNSMNRRSFDDSLSMARQQLAQAEDEVSSIQSRMTSFRQTRGDIDPQGSGEAQIKLVSELNTNLAVSRAQLSTMGAFVSHSSPQYLALQRQVHSLEAQAAAQSGRAAGGSSATIATSLGNYEDLRLRQDFAAKHYETAAADLEKAREQAQRQQLYLVRVVEPNMPVKSLYPERGRIVLTVFLALLLIYSIGWLIAAGVREHAA